MKQQLCQSCGMPLKETNKGTNTDGSLNNDYCSYCYQKGKFTQDFTMSQMIEFCTQFTDQINNETGWDLTPEQAKEQMKLFFPNLKRWKEEDQRTLIDKATNLLAQCNNVVLTSIDSKGYPRPVPMTKIFSKNCNEVWMATATSSVKVTDFKQNRKAGLCYSNYGDSVCLRGIIEIIIDDNTRKEMWQEWLFNHFPGGPTDPNLVFLHFVGKEATFWINECFSHEKF